VLVVAVVAGALAVLPWTGRRRVVALVVACLLLGVAGMQRALHGLAASPLTRVVDARVDVSVRATLVDDPDGTRWSTDGLARVDAWSARAGATDRGAGGRRVVVRAGGEAGNRLRLLDAGERFVARGWLAPLDGFDTRERWRHAVGVLHVTTVTAVAAPDGALLAVANRARRVVLAGADALGPTDRALLAGFLLGDTRGVPDAVQAEFRAAGLTHLTAVSGGNVAFVLALVAPVVRRLRVRGRVALSASVLVLFGTMTRWEPSVLRAIAMAAIALVAGHLGRPSTGLRVLLVAATALLLVDPFLLHSVGFLLSCTASLGIALWSRPIADRLRGPAWVRDVLGVTAAAQLGVLPVLVPVFGSVPLVALPANLVAVPLAEPLTMWGIVAGLLDSAFGFLSPVVARLVAVPTSALLHALVAVADVAARVPLALDARGLAGLVALGAAVAAAAVRPSRPRRRARSPGYVEVPRTQEGRQR
jgi:competence protein ComEC